jgi:hypothetical protein
VQQLLLARGVGGFIRGSTSRLEFPDYLNLDRRGLRLELRT